MKIFKKNLGFTMLELILVLSLLGAVSIGTGAYISNSFKDNNKLVDKAAVQTSVTALMNKLETAIKTADIPVLDKTSDSDFTIKQMGAADIKFEHKEGKVTANGIVYEHIKEIAVEGVGPEGKENGVHITITGTDDLYELEATYYTRNTISTADKEEKEYSLTLNYNGGQRDGKTEDNISGSKINLLNYTPDRAGYDFTEWNERSDGKGDKYNYEITLRADTILYAQWKEESSDAEAIYIVEHWLENVNDENYSKVGEENVTEDRFEQGYNNLKKTDGVFAHAEFVKGEKINNITKRLYYDRNEYTVTIKNNDVTSMKIKDKWGASVEVTANVGEGYEFEGWYDEEGKEVAKNKKINIEIPQKDVTYTARFVEKAGSATEAPTLAPRNTWYKGNADVKTVIMQDNPYTAKNGEVGYEVWNADVENSGSIKAWLFNDGTLLIAGNGANKIYANEDSRDMFNNSDFATAEEMHLAILDTSKVTKLSNMFENCDNLSKITLGTGFTYAGSETLSSVTKSWTADNGTQYDSIEAVAKAKRTKVTEYTTHVWMQTGSTRTGCKLIIEYKCDKCSAIKTESEISHYFNDSSWAYLDATYHERLCACKETEEKELHSFGEWTITKEPNCTETGKRVKTCTICKGSAEEVLPIDPNNHYNCDCNRPTICKCKLCREQGTALTCKATNWCINCETMACNACASVCDECNFCAACDDEFYPTTPNTECGRCHYLNGCNYDNKGYCSVCHKQCSHSMTESYSNDFLRCAECYTSFCSDCQEPWYLCECEESSSDDGSSDDPAVNICYYCSNSELYEPLIPICSSCDIWICDYCYNKDKWNGDCPKCGVID